MSWFVDAGEFFDVDMQQVSGRGMFVTHDGNGGFQHARLVQFQPRQDAADGGTAQGGGLSDPYAGPAFAPQTHNVPDPFAAGAAWGTMGTRTTIAQTGQALLAETPYPL